MREDHAGRIHRDKYGRSDKVNAPENHNREFQDGYRTGANSMAYRAEQIIEEEFLRVEVSDDPSDGFDGSGVSGHLAASAFSSFPRVGIASATSFSGRLQTNENSGHIGNHVSHSISMYNGFWHKNQQASLSANSIILRRDTL